MQFNSCDQDRAWMGPAWLEELWSKIEIQKNDDMNGTWDLNPDQDCGCSRNKQLLEKYAFLDECNNSNNKKTKTIVVKHKYKWQLEKYTFLCECSKSNKIILAKRNTFRATRKGISKV